MIPVPAWLTGIGTKLAFVGAFIFLLLLGVLKLIGIGREQERGKAAGKVLDAVKEANDVEARVDAAGAAERDELRRKWTRD